MATCPTCDGSGVVADSTDPEPCPASVAVGNTGHEVVSCWAEAPHDGIHVAMLHPPCKTCGGFDEHINKCPEIGDEAEPAQWYQWGWAASPEVVHSLPDETGDEWFRKHCPRASAARQ